MGMKNKISIVYKFLYYSSSFFYAIFYSASKRILERAESALIWGTFNLSFRTVPLQLSQIFA